MNDITVLAQAEINDAMAQLKQLSEYPTPSTQYARVLWKYITSLVEALEKAQHDAAVNWEAAASMNVENQELKQRIAELEKAASEPVAYIEQSKLEALARGVGAVYVKNTPELARPIALYAVSPAQESRTVTVTLPEVRITIAESKRRGMTNRELNAHNSGALEAVEAVSKTLTAAGINVEAE